ncbi:MAG: RluA family pseudouridine synthase [Pseudomonadota bacterium]
MTGEALQPKPTVWEVSERHAGWRLDRFLVEMIPKLSRTRLQKVIGERISLSWRETVAAGTRLKAGGRVIASFPKLDEVANPISCPILYEDSDILAVDKPAGLVVHPTNSCRANSLIEALRRERGESELRLVHRLDRETSGVLLLARSAEAARIWGKALMRRKVEKIYVARVQGRPPGKEGEVDQPIGRDIRSRVFVRRTVTPDGEQALTRYRVLSEIGGTSLVEFRPLTGRCHQLRVHAEWLGCPILGDPLYGKPDEAYLRYLTGLGGRERLFLHAWKLEGKVSGRVIRLEAPVPEIFYEEEAECLRTKRNSF